MREHAALAMHLYRRGTATNGHRKWSSLVSGRSIVSMTMATVALWFMCSHLAHAADLEGAWATDPAICSKIYTKSGGSFVFTRDADLYGSGFVVNGNRLTGKMATCTIKTRKQEGNTLHLIALCSTSIAFDTMQVTFNIIDDNKVMRIFPGMPELQTSYERCRS